ncbi:MAG: phosphoribosyltransferase family protein [Ruminococcus sp.]|nr:phosphoribosyltransferase family protein [Ruminococcus sp.]MEE0856478.1 phosphoribosyltransferase family protein [Ruminococcus sp.]MEE1171543.1 phosphoribosyltransferase family protein [Ruminococcus sp.]
MKTYNINIAGVERELEMFPVNDKVDIAAFIMFGDVEVTVKAAEALLKKCPEHDVVVSAEAKGIPLCYEMAKQGCGEYVIARKSVKVYMRNPVGVEVNSITTSEVQRLFLGESDVEFLKGKRVLIVDDVISTGESLAALEKLIEKTEAKIVGKAAVLAEGDAKNRDDIIFLEPLPLFFKD